jgi:hypothetical protein
MALAVQQDQPCAHIVDGALILDGFVESDSGVLAALADVDELDDAVHLFLQIGARASRAVGATIDSQVVERAFDAMSSQFDSKVVDLVNRISGTTNEFLDDEEGRLPVFLRALEIRLGEQFDALFDEDSKSSALAAMTKVFEQVAAERERELRRSIDPSDPESALGRMKRELLETMGEQFRLMLGHVTDIAAAVAKEEGRAEITQISAGKGRPYEEVLASALARHAARYGDSAEPVGDQLGATGRKTGDVLIRLAPSDCGGKPLAMLFEAKNWSKRPSVRKVHDELDRGMANRQAVVAVEIFRDINASPTRTTFSPFDNKAIAVFTGNEEDEWTLELAYLWARTETRRRTGEREATVDLAGAFAALDDARRGLDRAVTIKRYVGAAGSQLQLASSEVEALENDMRLALSDARTRLETPVAD